MYNKLNKENLNVGEIVLIILFTSLYKVKVSHYPHSIILFVTKNCWINIKKISPVIANNLFYRW